MAENELRRRLNPMDAFFIFGESEESPMTVGCVALFEGKMNFRKFVRSIDSRLHMIPRYRQRVVEAPFNIGMPTWEDDPDFDIANHIFDVKLDKPGSVEQLNELSEEVFDGMLDMEKPLWEIYIVKGMRGDRTGLIAKVHHAMVDGVAGIGLMHVMFDAVPDPPKIRKRKFNPEPIPDRSSLIYDAIWDNAIDGVEHWTNFQHSLNEYGRGRSANEVVDSLKEFGTLFADLLKPTDRFHFNNQFSGRRKFAFSEELFSEARAIRAASGGTLNDVVLATLAGAASRYVALHGQPTSGATLRVLCPVNIRSEHEGAAMGNRISFLPVNVPLDIDDPVQRLQVITAITSDLKKKRVPDAVALLFNFLQGSPPILQKLGLSALASKPMQSVLNFVPQIPPANLICTNVPGPQIPLYAVGHRMLWYFPLLPIVLEMGISCGITSYDQKLFFTFMADGNCAPDIHILRNYHHEAFEELRKAACVDVKEYVVLGPPVSVNGSANGRANGTTKPKKKPAKQRARKPKAASPKN